MSPDLIEIIGSIESSLADIAEKLEVASGLEHGLAELVETLSDRKGVDLAPLVAAIREARPTVTVNVPQSPPAQVVVMEPPEVIFEVKFPSQYGSAERSFTVRRRIVTITNQAE